MEFGFPINEALSLDSEGFCILDALAFAKSNRYFSTLGRDLRFNSPITREEKIAQILDRMGEASSKAQDLRAVITNFMRFLSSNHRIYIKAEDKLVFGFLKVGEKNLFYRGGSGQVHEINVLCVLDFYVHESCQRNGFGKALFEKMLEAEKVSPPKLAYDRPSPKLMGFLKKHYKLERYVPQNNNYVVYNDYFESTNDVLQPGPITANRALLQTPQRISQTPNKMSHRVGDFHAGTGAPQGNTYNQNPYNPQPFTNDIKLQRNERQGFSNLGKMIIDRQDVIPAYQQDNIFKDAPYDAYNYGYPPAKQESNKKYEYSNAMNNNIYYGAGLDPSGAMNYQKPALDNMLDMSPYQDDQIKAYYPSEQIQNFKSPGPNMTPQVTGDEKLVKKYDLRNYKVRTPWATHNVEHQSEPRKINTYNDNPQGPFSLKNAGYNY